MSGDDELEPFSRSVDEMFARLGLPEPTLMATLSSEWDQLAGPPWAGRSRPVYVKGGTLVVEASAGSMVAFLRYDAEGLLTRLGDRFGEGKIRQVDVRPPGRSGP